MSPIGHMMQIRLVPIRLEAAVIIMKLVKSMEKKIKFRKFVGIQSVVNFINFSMIF